MKTLTAVVLFVLAAIVWLAAVEEAECAWCSPMPCYNKYGCGMGCHCVKVGGEMQGTCVSID